MHRSRKYPLVGVIDIGSNSVRFVVYDGIKRSPTALFNEKHHCALGSGLQRSGRLSETAKDRARLTIRRYAQLAQHMQLDQVFAVATAALRDAEDGPDFAAELSVLSDIPIRLISGEEEARLAANGILASMYKPQGIAADLGGGSVELIRIEQREILELASKPLGALRLVDAYGADVDAMRRHVRQLLSDMEWLRRDTKRFYAIGGGFRTIASVHMRQHGYPLPILHAYSVDAASLLPFCDWLLSLDATTRNAMDGLEARRADVFVPSVVVLQEILRVCGAAKVTFSTSGIREGLLYDQLPAKTQKEKALMASLQNLLASERSDLAYATALDTWMSPLLQEEKDVQRMLRRAMCQLGDISLTVHPEFRADWAFEHIIQSSLWGISHRQRVLSALALYHRYRKKWKRNDAVLDLLSERDKLWAALCGQAASLAFEISGGAVELLKMLPICITKSGELYLGGTEDLHSMLPAAAEKRLEALSGLFNAYSNLFK